MKRIVLSTLAIGSTLVLSQAAPLAVDVSAGARCIALEETDLSGVQDAPAQIMGARPAEAAENAPAYCRVEGKVSPQIEFEVRLPSSYWNGKFLALANVRTGSECNAYLKRGYACMPMFRNGKKGRTDEDWLAIYRNDLKARVDSTRSSHLLTLAGKAIVHRFYSKDIRRSYFMGCSAGGYEALTQVQTFPWDFDGIVAGAPPLDIADWLMQAVWTARSFLDERGQPILNSDDIQILHRSVLAVCDLDDGVEDGIIGNPVDCKFDPSELLCKGRVKAGCLARSQVEAVKRIYAGPTTSAGERTSTPGVLPGSELGWGWFGRELLRFAEPFFEYVFYGASPELEAMEFDFDRDYKRLGLGAGLAPPTNPDLRKFKSVGGKLLAYQGAIDTVLVAGGIVDYYETTERTMGGRAATQDFFRLFMVPGMDHCGGGVGAHAIDYLSYLETWVEQGKAPDVMIGAHVSDTYWTALASKMDALEFPLDPAILITFTRPVYPYPIYAKYKGTGDPNDATNFRPVRPQASAQGK